VYTSDAQLFCLKTRNVLGQNYQRIFTQIFCRDMWTVEGSFSVKLKQKWMAKAPSTNEINPKAGSTR
jgi:hypothetical protein